MGFKISNGIVLSVISFDPKSSSCRSTEGSTISIVTPIFSISRLSILYSINLQICSNLKFLLNHFSFPGSSPRPAIIFIWSSHTTHRCLTAHDRLFFFFFFFFICNFFINGDVIYFSQFPSRSLRVSLQSTSDMSFISMPRCHQKAVKVMSLTELPN